MIKWAEQQSETSVLDKNMFNMDESVKRVDTLNIYTSKGYRVLAMAAKGLIMDFQ